MTLILGLSIWQYSNVKLTRWSLLFHLYVKNFVVDRNGFCDMSNMECQGGGSRVCETGTEGLEFGCVLAGVSG